MPNQCSASGSNENKNAETGEDKKPDILHNFWNISHIPLSTYQNDTGLSGAPRSPPWPISACIRPQTFIRPILQRNCLIKHFHFHICFANKNARGSEKFKYDMIWFFNVLFSCKSRIEGPNHYRFTLCIDHIVYEWLNWYRIL